jgi:hypothetical protein
VAPAVAVAPMVTVARCWQWRRVVAAAGGACVRLLYLSEVGFELAGPELDDVLEARLGGGERTVQLAVLAQRGVCRLDAHTGQVGHVI